MEIENMSERAILLLCIVRYANREHIMLGGEFKALAEKLGMTTIEQDQIGEVLKMDYLSRGVSIETGEILDRMSRSNPHGVA